jgi:hypothetical protein
MADSLKNILEPIIVFMNGQIIKHGVRWMSGGFAQIPFDKCYDERQYVVRARDIGVVIEKINR